MESFATTIAVRIVIQLKMDNPKPLPKKAEIGDFANFAKVRIATFDIRSCHSLLFVNIYKISNLETNYSLADCFRIWDNRTRKYYI